MKALARNKQTIYYSNYTGKTEIIDSNGLNTGEYKNTYSAALAVGVNLSAAKGESNLDMFGTNVNYTNTIVTDTDLGWDENTILWVGKEPYVDGNMTPHTHIVVSVAKSLNSVTYAIQKVDVS